MGITKIIFAIKPENYTLLYVGELSELQKRDAGATLEAIFENSTLTTCRRFQRTFAICQRYSGASSERTEYGSFCGFFFGYTRSPDFYEQTPEKEEMQDTSGHNVQKTEPEIDG